MIIVLAGVTGSGKTTTGQALATKLNWLFADGDDFHSDSNKQKMEKGIPLTDEDRVPWLSTLHDIIKRWMREDINGIIACSALRSVYRQILKIGLSDDLQSSSITWDMPMPVLDSRISDSNTKLLFVLLNGSEDVIAERLRRRQNHFMNPCLLQSQLATLEHPSTDENVLIVDASQTVSDIVDIIEKAINVR